MNTQQENASILLIYTGGTIGMIENSETGVLESFNFQHLKEHMPELKKLGYGVSTIQFDHLWTRLRWDLNHGPRL